MPTLRKYTKRPIWEVFLSKIDQAGSCWLWDAACGNHGYGVLNRNNKVISAHRLSYELYYGLIPKGKHVLHTCDVRPCVNPDHLFLGSNSDNVADKVAKERHAFGEASVISKLTNAQVMSIRQKYAQGGCCNNRDRGSRSRSCYGGYEQSTGGSI